VQIKKKTVVAYFKLVSICISNEFLGLRKYLTVSCSLSENVEMTSVRPSVRVCPAVTKYQLIIS
jgi:hypothetical protein